MDLPRLTITPRHEQGRARLFIEGDLDLASGDELTVAGAEVITDGLQLLEVDVAGVTFCDSSGLAALLALRRASDQRSVPMILTNPTPQLDRILILTELKDYLTQLPAADQA